jgi:hypothetical protein
MKTSSLFPLRSKTSSLLPLGSKTSSLFPLRSIRSPRDALRDPALWAWLAVALLAIIPARAVFAGH